ncbi:restriction endonuclease subunit S [Enterococcus faecalis]|nr:restriction endonuclease subunit S [Enterococcus faecalis]UTJ08955.1 restriction endonuclease subunit S [Enterococcus faecalis]
MKKVPRLRFRGFQEDWELCKLSTEFEKVNERNDGSLGKEHWISVAKMYFQNPDKVQSNNIDTRTYVMRTGDIAFEGHPNKEFKFGRFVANDIGTGVVSELFPIYRHKQEYDNYYWKNAIQIERVMGPIFAKSITSSGNSSNKLDPNHFLRQQVFIPKLEEQKKIGLFLKKLDDTITLHQRKLDQLKELKKAYLQVIFPAKDERVPKLRFADFEEEWELRKLEDLANKYNNLRIPITASKRIYGNTPYYGANGIQDFVEGYTHDGEFILVAEDGASNLKDYPVQYVNGKVWVNNHAHVLQAKRSKADNKFLMNAIKSINIEPFLVGGGRSKLNSEVMMNLEINTPSKDEQLKISTLCKQLDDITALYQNKLNQLKNLKKSYLQNMFI